MQLGPVTLAVTGPTCVIAGDTALPSEFGPWRTPTTALPLEYGPSAG